MSRHDDLKQTELAVFKTSAEAFAVADKVDTHGLGAAWVVKLINEGGWAIRVGLMKWLRADGFVR
jgi:hypothetical protein